MSAVEVHHVVSGPEDAPVVVLSSSLGSTYAMWDAQAEALAKLANAQQPRVITPAIIEHLTREDHA